MGILSFIGSLFGSTSSFNKTVDTAANAIDRFVYTKGEKAEDNERAKEAIYNWIEQTSGQNLTRRFLAVLITMVWISEFVISGILDIIYVIFPTHPLIGKVAQEISHSGYDLSSYVTVIITFYFSAPHISSIIGKIKKKEDQ